MRLSYFGYLPKRNYVIGGGEVKTKSVLRALYEYGGFDVIDEIDTSNWKKNIVSLIWKMIVAALKKDIIVFVASTPSFQVVLPLLNFIHRLNGVEIHFIPVGNCMTRNFQSNKKKRQIKTVKGIYCQTESMANALTDIGLNNVFVMHNFKFIKKYCQEYQGGEPYKLVYFSRVSEEKGIFECIDVIKKINAQETKCTLDIYGKIDADIENRFQQCIDSDINIQYCGNASPEESSEIIKDYYMMVFPTKYEGEGFPGAIIDTLAAGVPVLTSRFGGYCDILRENEDSICFEFGDYAQLYEKLEYAINNTEIINAMRKKSSNNYSKYSPENEIQNLLTNIKFEDRR